MSNAGHGKKRRPSAAIRRKVYLESDAADPTPESKLLINKRGELVEEYRSDLHRSNGERRRLPLRRLGFTATDRDRQKALAVIREQLRREGWDEGTGADVDLQREKFDREAGERLTDLETAWHPHLLRSYEKLQQVSVCPNRRHIRDHIELKAIRRLPEMQEAEKLLTRCDFGRPSNRKLARATFQRLALGDCVPEIRKAVKGFEGSNRELDWAYFDTADPEKIKPDLRDETALRRAMKSMLERNDPETCWDWNASVFDRLRKRHPDVGRYLAVDATAIEAHLEQSGDVSPEFAQLANRGTGARFGHHGSRNRRPKSWRGWKLLLLVDLKTGLVLVGHLIPANAPEYPYIPELLLKAFKLMPWLDPEYLVADSEMDRQTRLAFDLQSRFGITPAFDLRENVSKDFAWSETDGVPRCSKHGAMHLQQVELDPYRAVPLDDVEDFEDAKRAYGGRMRWLCKECRALGETVRADTWIRHNARIYTALPRQGDNWRAGMRQALMLRRNHAESVNSQIKLRGIGARNQFKARWVTKESHIQWLTYMAAIGPTLRREAHESGLYAKAAADAQQLQLVKKELSVPANSATGLPTGTDATISKAAQPQCGRKAA
jgi:hypothetical protein